MLKYYINKFSQNPCKLFLIDGSGAMLTAFLLFGILRSFNDYFSMPETTLIFLSLSALIFCLYDVICFLVLKANWAPYLKTISIANFLYCAFTAGLLIFHYSELTFSDLLYFLTEIGIISILAFIELKTAMAIKQKSNCYNS